MLVTIVAFIDREKKESEIQTQNKRKGQQQVLIHDFMMSSKQCRWDVSCLFRERRTHDCSLERVRYSFSIEKESTRYFYASEVSFLLCVSSPSSSFVLFHSMPQTNDSWGRGRNRNDQKSKEGRWRQVNRRTERRDFSCFAFSSFAFSSSAFSCIVTATRFSMEVAFLWQTKLMFPAVAFKI